MTTAGGGAAAAPAKLNLTLAVTGRRPDGFHDLHSVFVPLAFGDEIEVTGQEDGPAATDRLAIEWPDVPGDLPVGPDNLVLRAIAATRRALVAGGADPATLPALSVRLVKRIPAAAGLGGGSGDAAATLRAALGAWGVALPPEALRDVAAALGSDVPFFLAGSAALVTGRGEFVEPLPPLRGVAPAVLVVTPRVPVATPAVFAAYAAGARPSDGVAAATLATSERLAVDWRAGLPATALVDRAAELAAANDLLPAALAVAPALAGWREALAGLLGRPVGLSGSGPTSWALYSTLAEAEAAADLVRAAAADGRLPAIASDAPFVVATAIRPATAHNYVTTAPKGR